MSLALALAWSVSDGPKAYHGMKIGLEAEMGFWTEKINEIDPTERRKPSLDLLLLLENVPEVIGLPHSER